jgi:DNA-binding NtrC family response regulator
MTDATAASRVLVVDDEPEMLDLLASGLAERGYEATCKTSADDAFEVAMREDFAAVVTDVRMRGMDGLDLCVRLNENRPDVPVIVITAFGSLETAIATIRAGAFDFLTKPFDIDLLAIALERATQQRALREEVKRLQNVVGGPRSHDDMVGTSPAMRAVFEMIDRVAGVDAPVLVTGESGTGKELVARALHRRSRRSTGPFVAVNCAALPEALLESELFGHVRGAFTDARTSKKGLFVEASGGTLFLDEIGELPMPMQAKLLRALETRRVRPVGGTSEVPFDVNLVAATNRDLEAGVAEGRFRDDLFYRLDVVHIALPPLRSRAGDVLLLAQSILARAALRMGKLVTGMSPAVADKLVAYAWPGNVRELQNCMERAVALARFEQLAVDDLPDRVRNYRPAHVLVVSDDPSELVPLEEVERRYILRVMQAAGGNKSIASRILGLDRKTLYRRLDSYGVPGRDSDPR